MNAHKMKRVLENGGFRVVDEAVLPARAARHTEIPSSLHPAVRKNLELSMGGLLYAHQSKAIESALTRHDVCLSTQTASGKSLVFMSVAADIILRNPEARVLALYPAKALIHDQLGKWSEQAERNGFRVGYIHGGVAREDRLPILDDCHVVLMTPDVAHAWLLHNLAQEGVRRFLGNLHLLILDEAHVYDGVFGSNMAFFLRRLQYAARDFQLIAPTATVGDPCGFMESLTGRIPKVFAADADASGCPEKSIFVVRPYLPAQSNEQTLLRLLVAQGHTPFLAFMDSRKAVEQLVSRLTFGAKEEGESMLSVYPYRAGYEDEDRRMLQEALSTGEVSGIVATSALELGLDIGDLNTVVMVGLPNSMKAFWQRLGRGGRKTRGMCIIYDGAESLRKVHGGLAQYFNRAIEPNWLYLDNRYCQYSNALCAAHEARALNDVGGRPSKRLPYKTLPDRFHEYILNDINPKESLAHDLMELKQRAQDTPHHEFPIRCDTERSFSVIDHKTNTPIGTVTFSQMLREAYPGAIYYYMAQPYRVNRVNFKDGTIHAKRDKRYTTTPMSQIRVFPRLSPAHQYSASRLGFLIETGMQVAERVVGFEETRGANREGNKYGPDSPYYHRDILRFFETTGVCWHFEGCDTGGMAAARAIASALCSLCSIESRDIGVGPFYVKTSPLGGMPIRGVCIYDAAHGSLRLTQQLFTRFREVVSMALNTIGSIQTEEAETVHLQLSGLLSQLPGLSSPCQTPAEELERADDEHMHVMVAPGERAVYMSNGIGQFVKVRSYQFTPKGVMYRIEAESSETLKLVGRDYIRPIEGETRLERWNAMTDDRELV